MACLPSRLARLLAIGLALCGGAARADGLLRIAGCRIVDDHGPIKAIGVNYVDGFWGCAKNGKREAYLPYLDALAEAKIPFIRMGFGPWAGNKADSPQAPQIADFVENRDRYFERLAIFLADLRARHIGVVLDVFWNIDPYTVYFKEPAAARADPKSRTFGFLKATLAELARRHGQHPNIWMIEFLNEGDLYIDFNGAPHSRADLDALIEGLASALRAGGDKHLVDSGNALPRPAAQHLVGHEGWRPDSREDFLRALGAETPAGVTVASVHIYPEKAGARPWTHDDVLATLSVLSQNSAKTCQPVFVGEFGAMNPVDEKTYIRSVADSGIQLAALWGFGRPQYDAYSFAYDERGQALLAFIGQQGRAIK